MKARWWRWKVSWWILDIISISIKSPRYHTAPYLAEFWGDFIMCFIFFDLPKLVMLILTGFFRAFTLLLLFFYLNGTVATTANENAGFAESNPGFCFLNTSIAFCIDDRKWYLFFSLVISRNKSIEAFSFRIRHMNTEHEMHIVFATAANELTGK